MVKRGKVKRYGPWFLVILQFKRGEEVVAV
jgi:hypothetical protein